MIKILKLLLGTGYYASALMFVSAAKTGGSDDDLLNHIKGRHQRRRRNLQQQDLQQLWWFRHETTYEVLPNNNTTTTTLRFFYRTSDYIEDDMTRAIILDAETCNIPIIYNTEQYGFSLSNPISNNLPGDGYGFRDWVVDLDITTGAVPPNITNDNVTALIAEGRTYSSNSLPSIYKTEESSNNGNNNHTIGIWNFCVLIGLFSDGTPDAGLINWQDFEVEIEEDYDLHTLEVTKFERPPFHIPVEAHTYFCDEDNIEIEPHPLLIEGTELRICVIPPGKNKYEMITIDSFQYEALGAEDGRRAIKQAAINEGGEPARNSLTTFDCTKDLCVIRSLLLSSFYTTNVEVFANGYSVFRKLDTTEKDSPDDDEQDVITRSRISLEFETLLHIYDRTAHPSSMPSASPTTLNDMASSSMASPSATSGLGIIWMLSLVTMVLTVFFL